MIPLPFRLTAALRAEQITWREYQQAWELWLASQKKVPPSCPYCRRPYTEDR